MAKQFQKPTAPDPDDDYNFRSLEKQRELEAVQKRREQMLTDFRNGGRTA